MDTSQPPYTSSKAQRWVTSCCCTIAAADVAVATLSRLPAASAAAHRIKSRHTVHTLVVILVYSGPGLLTARVLQPCIPASILTKEVFLLLLPNVTAVDDQALVPGLAATCHGHDILQTQPVCH